MKKTMKKYLISSLVLGTACFGLLGFSTLGAANADETDPFANFKVQETAEIRTTAPVGIRFTTVVDAAIKAEVGEDATFGTMVIPKALLTDGADEGTEVTIDDLTIGAAKAANVVSTKWFTEDQTSYTAAIVGQQDGEGNYTALPESFYDDVFYARGYVTYNGKTVYTSNYCEKSIAYVASAALAAGETSALYTSIVDYVNPTLEWDESIADGVELELGCEAFAVALSAESDAKGLVVKYSTTDENVVKYANGTLIAVGAGTATVSAQIGSEIANLDVKVEARSYNYGEISDLSYGSDMFYYSANRWGSSAFADLGVTMSTETGEETVSYGKSVALSDAEYEALVAAGYKGSLTKKSVWRADQNIVTTCNATGGTHNGYQTGIFVGSATLNYDLIEKMMDTTYDANGAYISVWVRSATDVNMRYSNIVPMFEANGAYSGKHMGIAPNLSLSKAGTVPAGTWVELTCSIDALRTAYAGVDFNTYPDAVGGVKGLGFSFYVNTNTTAGAVELGDTVENFDIYSIEICYPNANDYTFATGKTDVRLSSFGYANFTENFEIYDGTKLLTQGTDYTYAEGKVNGLDAGTYTVQYTVSGNGFEQTTVTRTYNFSNQVTEIDTTNFSHWGWGTGYTPTKTTLSAKPNGYNGTRTDLTAISGNGYTQSNGTSITRISINISALTSNIAGMQDGEYLSVWMRSSLPAGATTAAIDTASVFLCNNVNAYETGYAQANLRSGILTSANVIAGTWINLRFSKSELNVTNVADMKYLGFQFYETTNLLHVVDFYAVEVLSPVNNGVVDLDPANLLNAGWGNGSGECKNQGLATTDIPTDYNGSRKGDWALYWESVNSSTNTMAINISSFLANIDELMDDNDYLSIWLKYSPNVWYTYDSSIVLTSAAKRDVKANGTVLVSSHYTTENNGNLTNGTWVEVKLTKEALKTAYEANNSLVYLMFYVSPSNTATVQSYLYDIALVKA